MTEPDDIERAGWIEQRAPLHAQHRVHHLGNAGEEEEEAEGLDRPATIRHFT